MNNPVTKDVARSSEAWACCSRLDATAWLTILAPVLCLLPFLNKAFHIDDPVYLWVAQHIQEHPLDFYGFSKNWSFFEEPMYAINKNPPGVSYFIALVALFAGWNEIALHAAFLVPLFALSFGTYRLAQMFTARPRAAVLAAMLAPVTLVSSSNVMSDTLTLALSVWAFVLWICALKTERSGIAWVAMTLLGAAILTKYLAVCFVPLAIAYALMRRDPVKRWLPPLAALFAIVGGYLLWSYRLYGVNPLAGAAAFATGFDEPERTITPGVRFTTGLTFAGGCYVALLFLLPVFWRRSTALWVFGIPAVSLVALFVFGSSFGQMLMHPAFEPLPGFYPQVVLFAVAGFHLLYLAADDLRRNRTPESVVLALWVFGFFVFSTFVNWTINGRTMLPIAPAAGILISRRIETLCWNQFDLRLVAPIAMSTAIALVVLWSDTKLANAGREAARRFAETRETFSGEAWIQGNWGPRWYFEAAGAKPFDAQAPSVRVGDVVIQSSNNLVYPLPRELTHSLRTDAIPAGRWVTTMDRRTGAGFYSSVWGPLPYAFGPVPDERYHYLRLAPQ